MKPTLLRITKQRIKDGDVDDIFGCPIALTLRTKFPRDRTYCGFLTAAVNGVLFRTTRGIQAWQRELMINKPAPPITIVVNHDHRTIGIKKP